MNNARKNSQPSFAKKMSAPLILSPPKVVGYQQQTMKAEEELDSSDELENEEKELGSSDNPENIEGTPETEDTPISDDESESELSEEDLMAALKEAFRLQQLADHSHFSYRPKNGNGSFFFIETTSEEDDEAIEDSSIESPEEKEPVFDVDERNEQTDGFLEESILEEAPDSEDDELFLDSPSIEKKAFASEKFYDEYLSAADPPEETKWFIDDEDLLEEGMDVLEESIQEDNFTEQDSEDDAPSYDPYPIEEEEFVSGERFHEDLTAVDSQKETEFIFDDGDLLAQADNVLENSIYEENSTEQDLENDEPFHGSHLISEEEFVSEESYEDLSAIDSLEEDELAFDREEPNEEADDSLEEATQEEDESLPHSPPVGEKDIVCDEKRMQDEYKKKNHGYNHPKPDKIKKDLSPIAKLPVLLAATTIDLDIFDSFDLAVPIGNITKIEWTVHRLEGHVLLPSTTIFLKGVLVADIEYVSDAGSHSMQTIKIQVPWKTTTKVDWISPPLMPSKSHEEYMFQCHGGEEPSFHREYHEQFSEQIQFHLRQADYTWNEELVSKGGTPKLHIQGNASLSIDLSQPQYVTLHSI